MDEVGQSGASALSPMHQGMPVNPPAERASCAFRYLLAAADANQDSISAKSVSDRTTSKARAASSRCGDPRAGPVTTAVTSRWCNSHARARVTCTRQTLSTLVGSRPSAPISPADDQPSRAEPRTSEKSRQRVRTRTQRSYRSLGRPRGQRARRGSPEARVRSVGHRRVGDARSR